MTTSPDTPGRIPGASSASDCLALQGRPVKGAPSGRVAEAMAQAPPLTVPPFQAVSGSYRMRGRSKLSPCHETEKEPSIEKQATVSW